MSAASWDKHEMDPLNVVLSKSGATIHYLALNHFLTGRSFPVSGDFLARLKAGVYDRSEKPV